MPRGYKVRVCSNVKCEHHGKDQTVGAKITNCDCGNVLQKPPK